MFDRIGNERVITDTHRSTMIAQLCQAGYASKITLSLSLDHDAVWFPSRPAVIAVEGKHFGHLHQMFLPKLRLAGISDADVQTMLVKNPKELLSL